MKKGERFEFGKNWYRFLSVLDDERIAEACRSLDHMLGAGWLTGKTFLDVNALAADLTPVMRREMTDFPRCRQR